MLKRAILVMLCAMAVNLWAPSASAVPVAFSWTQENDVDGSGSLTIAGVSFAAPAPFVVQKDGFSGPVPDGAVGVISEFAAPNPGTPNGVHLQWPTGTFTTSQTIAGKNFELEVPFVLESGAAHSYSVDLTDDNTGVGGTNDAEGTSQFAGWVGNDGSGHRHSGTTIDWVAGVESHTASATTTLGGNADGDDIGFTASTRDSFTGEIYVEQIEVNFALDGTLRVDGAISQPVGVTFTQTDAQTGTGAVSALIDTTPVGGPGELQFVGMLPAATITQKDTTMQPVPSDKVGFMTAQSDANPGAPTGVHVGFDATMVTMQATDGTNVYEIDVPLEMLSGAPAQYRTVMSDDNAGVGGTNDAVGDPQFAGWIGDDGGGHRHTDGNIGFEGGLDRFEARVSTNLGGNAAGDSLGYTAGLRDNGALSGTVFVDSISFAASNALVANLETFRVVGPAEAVAPRIESVMNINSLDGGDVYQTGQLFEDSEAFIDRDHEYNNIPAFLLGADYVLTANDDKEATSGFSIELTTAETSDVYLVIDNRVGDGDNADGPQLGNGIMDWVLANGWEETDFEIGIDEGGDGIGPAQGINQFGTLYVMENVSAGRTLTFLEQFDDSTGDPGSRNMFGIIVAQPLQTGVPEPASVLLGLLGVAALGMRRRRCAAV